MLQQMEAIVVSSNIVARDLYQQQVLQGANKEIKVIGRDN